MVRLVEDMQAGGYGLPVLVGSNDPDAGGLEKARALGVETYAVDHKPYGKDRAAFEAEMLKPLLAADPDVVCLAGYMRVLTPAFVDHFKGRMLNIHPSLLPKYPGLHTHARAIAAGDAHAGCSVHEVTAVLDDGPIFGQATVPILEGDSESDLAARVLIQEHRLYPAVLRRFLAGDRSLLEVSSAS
jgi:phosphoribosylglycinamide formyltransferase-1